MSCQKKRGTLTDTRFRERRMEILLTHKSQALLSKRRWLISSSTNNLSYSRHLRKNAKRSLIKSLSSIKKSNKRIKTKNKVNSKKNQKLSRMELINNQSILKFSKRSKKKLIQKSRNTSKRKRIRENKKKKNFRDNKRSSQKYLERRQEV